MSAKTSGDVTQFLSAGAPAADGFLRADVTAARWKALAQGCAGGLQDLCALWFESGRMRMALISRDRSARVIVSLPCRKNSYPSVGAFHAPAIRLERAMRDLYGVEPEGLPDPRPWLDHGVWPGRKDHGGTATRYEFLPVEGESLHQIPVGPVHAGIIEPGHFRFTANGETVVRLEERLGYVHKGIEALCAGKPVADVARIVARVSGDSTVAYSYAFARAVEAACGITPPPRAIQLRAVMAELERIAHHVNDFGAICNDASAVAINAHCTLLRERLLQAADATFGHRLMMDGIVPGGVAADLTDGQAGKLLAVLGDVERDFAAALRSYDGSPSILDRTVTTGILRRELAMQFAAGGYVGRASGRDFDARRDTAYAPYDALRFEVVTRQEGDVNARAWVRADEIAQSIAILRRLLSGLENGPIHAEIREFGAGEGAALAEAFRGDVFLSVSVNDNGTIRHCHVRDASWFQWPLLEAAIEGNIVADFPLCNKSFNCSYSGHDL